MKILTRLCSSLDGCIATADGAPIQLAYPAWDADVLGFYDLQARCDAVLMGRSTFEPALSAPHWPWKDLDVYVLGSHRPTGTPDRVVVDDDAARLLERLREANSGGDVHLVGGPRTIETYRALGALDEFRILLLPMLAGSGRRLTPDVDSKAELSLLETKRWPTGVVELTYRVGP